MSRQNVLASLFAMMIMADSSATAKNELRPEQAGSSIANKSIAVGRGPDALFLTPDETYLYVANVEDAFISVIDVRSDRVVQTIDGTDYPWGFTRLGESNLVAVSGWDKGVDVIDFTRHEIVRSKRYEENLGGIISTIDGETLFVIATETNKVLKLDAGSLEIVDEYTTGNGPDGVGLSKSGRKLYVTNTKDGTISIIDVKTKDAGILTVGNKPELIHANHDRSLLFISNFFGNKIHVIDSNAGKIIHEITGLDGPEEAVLSKSEKTLYVVNFNSSKVFTYDAKTYEKLPQVYSVGSKPIGVVSAVTDTKLYVSNYGDNSVTVIEPGQKQADVQGSGSEVLVKFKPGVDERDITRLASDLGLQQIKTVPALRLRLFKITSDKSRDEVISVCEKQAFVEYAEPNQKVGIKNNP